MSELTRKRAERLVELMGEGGVLEVDYGPDGKGHEAAGCGVTSDLKWTFRWWCSFLDGPGQGRVEPYHTPPRADDKGLRDLVKQVVAELPAPPDPRLANLPDDLRSVAEEFLSLHEAWDTEFTVLPLALDSPLWWKLVWGRCYLHQGYVSIGPGGAKVDFDRRLGKLRICAKWIHEDEPRWSFEFESHSKSDEMRKSHDFAEFVQRFRGGSDATP